MNRQTLLIELGTEELPPKSLSSLSAAFHQAILNDLLDAKLIENRDAQKATPYASPRRLAISVSNVAETQENQSVQRRGPAVDAAYDDSGKPTQAALGFARSCGVEIEQLERLKTDKGEWLAFNVEQKGKTIDALITDIINNAIKKLPIAKRMRWGSGSAEFVRPVHWLIVLFGDRRIDSNVLGIQSGTTSQGHRFHSEGDLTINHADHYAKILQQQGSVVARFLARRDTIESQIRELATSVNGHIHKDNALLDEVTGLVEYPNALMGQFDHDFLNVPQECLISSMRDHQKYFHLFDDAGKLLPNFITVSNINSHNPQQVIEGNERVLRARLSDAKFFWETDQKTPLAERVATLGKVLFHVKLGSVLDKTHRLQPLAAKIAQLIGADTKTTERAAFLAKADLVTDMVGEFDELQGTMGHYYANIDGEPAQVGAAIEQHYWPRFAGDDLPQSAEACAVSIADKIDTLVGIFSAGEIPTGDKDPYGLRRATLGILRILIEKQYTLSLSELVALCAQIYKEQGIEVDQATQNHIIDFMQGRLPSYYQQQDFATSTINSVLAAGANTPFNFHQRVIAVESFRKLDAAQDLSAANKRIANILKKQAQQIGHDINFELLEEDAEKALFSTIQNLEKDCESLFAAGDYSQGLTQLASLRQPIDAFFENVMVMAEKPAIQTNRLALLKRVRALFIDVADISLLQN